MKFSAAMKALEEGKKVRQVIWDEECWIDKRGDNVSAKHELINHNLKEWELYEEPEKLLSFAEMIQGLKYEKKFRRKHWTAWVGLEHLDVLRFSIEDFEATDWIEVK